MLAVGDTPADGFAAEHGGGPAGRQVEQGEEDREGNRRAHGQSFPVWDSAQPRGGRRDPAPDVLQECSAEWTGCELCGASDCSILIL
ncbi:hypothetical protein D3C80_1459180 [compost metagenome]